MRVTFKLVLATFCILVGADAASAQTAFYRAPASEAEGAPGTLVRQEIIDGAPLGATTYRVLYRSTGLDDKPIFVSGVVIVPPGDPPPGGRPIVAWAHPTSGVVPRCAPSLAIFLFEQIQGLRSFIRDGYVVAATDYPGLGTPETHPYLVGVSEGRAVLDWYGSRARCLAPAAARTSWSGAIRKAATPLCSLASWPSATHPN